MLVGERENLITLLIIAGKWCRGMHPPTAADVQRFG